MQRGCLAFERVDHGIDVAFDLSIDVVGRSGLYCPGPNQPVFGHVVQTGFRDVDIVLIDARRFVVTKPGSRIPTIEAEGGAG